MSKFLSSAVPGYCGRHRKTVRRRMPALYFFHTSKLHAIVPNLGLIALTSDLWKNSRQMHFICVTMHAFTSTFEHVPIIIGCRRIIGPHIASSIERYISFELDRIGIKPEQLISITTDNGSNVKNATSSNRFGQRISCMVHNLNLVVNKGL